MKVKANALALCVFRILLSMFRSVGKNKSLCVSFFFFSSILTFFYSHPHCKKIKNKTLELMLSVSDSKVVVLEVVTRAVAKLNLDWHDEKTQAMQSKLDDRYLTSGQEQPPHWASPVLP